MATKAVLSAVKVTTVLEIGTPLLSRTVAMAVAGVLVVAAPVVVSTRFNVMLPLVVVVVLPPPVVVLVGAPLAPQPAIIIDITASKKAKSALLGFEKMVRTVTLRSHGDANFAQLRKSMNVIL
jgi:hypothetical protein